MTERITTITLVPEGEPIFCHQAVTISIVDEAAGEFVRVSQVTEKDENYLAIDTQEWPALRAAIDKMILACQTHE